MKLLRGSISRSCLVVFVCIIATSYCPGTYFTQLPLPFCSADFPQKSAGAIVITITTYRSSCFTLAAVAGGNEGLERCGHMTPPAAATKPVSLA